VDATETAETEVVARTVDQLHMGGQEWLDAYRDRQPFNRPVSPLTIAVAAVTL
jgi:hypothetical protein